MKNPYLNAILAAGYIALVVTVINTVGSVIDPDKTILIPMGMLSLLVFSVAVMGFLFFYQPVCFLIDNKKDEAVKFFSKSLGLFAVLGLGFFVLFLLVHSSF